MPAGNTYQFDPSVGLPSRQTVPTSGSMPIGGGSPNVSHSMGGGGGGFDYAGAAGTAAPIMAAIFGGGDNKSAQQASGNSDQLASMAKMMFGEGHGATDQALTYLMHVAGGDPTALLNATAPERGRVLDQYDTAKKALMFTPRGGGQASATADLEASKAATMTSQTATARTSAVNALAQIGAQESAQGTAGLNSAIQGQESAAARQDKQDQASGSAWGTIISIGLMAAMAASHSSLKEAITPTEIDPQKALAGIRRLELRKWQYKGDGVTHMGPMAEDFKDIFGVGDGITLHPADVFGVCLAVMKALASEGKRATP